MTLIIINITYNSLPLFDSERLRLIKHEFALLKNSQEPSQKFCVYLRLYSLFIFIWDVEKKLTDPLCSSKWAHYINHQELLYYINLQKKYQQQMSKQCEVCKNAKAKIKRPKTQQPICEQCFFVCFESQIHQTIVKYELFKAGEKIAIGTSGGKDSTVLNHVLNKLNKKHNYGVEFYMLAIDEGIKGYRDDSLEAVKRNQKVEGMPLEILSYKELYGWTMDDVVKTIGQTNNCTYCGVLRRQALERGAVKLGCTKVVTGHNADDIAETVLMNMLRGDLNRLAICVDPISGEEEDPLSLPRVKPLKYAYEKQIVLYAYHKKLDYFSTQCIYSPFAYRGHVRELIKQMESIRPQSIIDIIYSAESIKINEKKKPITKQKCQKCGFMTSNKICKACILLEGLNKQRPKQQIQFTQ